MPADPLTAAAPTPPAVPSGVTVIIPAYNYDRYLPAAINSALAQDYPVVEVIVVDDGSTDSTREVAARYGERSRYVYQENAGLSAARNTGLRLATHAFVAFLDADDLWEPAMISTCMRAFAELPGDYAVVACPGQFVDEQNRPVATAAGPARPPGPVAVVELLLRNRFFADAVVVRRAAVQDCGGFDAALTSSEDRDLWLRLAARARIWLVPEVLVRVRQHPGSMSRNARRMQVNNAQVLRKAFRAGVVPAWRLDLRGQAWAYHHHDVAWMYHSQGADLTACWYELVSLLRWPFFARPARLQVPPLFRLRSLRRFLWSFATGKAPT